MHPTIEAESPIELDPIRASREQFPVPASHIRNLDQPNNRSRKELRTQVSITQQESRVQEREEQTWKNVRRQTFENERRNKTTIS